MKITDNPTQLENKLELPERIFAFRRSDGGNSWHYERLEPSDVEYVRAARVYFCSCGGACTAEEYIKHYFELGHDHGEPAPSPSSPVPAEQKPLCVLCGHNDLDADGVTCAAPVPICSDDHHGIRHCDCKCRFPAATPTPVEQERGLWNEAASIVQACLNVHSTYSDAEREFAAHLVEVFNTRDKHPDYKHRNTVRAYPAATPERPRQVFDSGFAATPAPVEQDCSRLENWPIPDVLNHLVNATEHLLHHHDCDEHGHETWKYAAEAARKHVAQLSATPSPSLAAREAAEDVIELILMTEREELPRRADIEAIISRRFCSPVPAAGDGEPLVADMQRALVAAGWVAESAIKWRAPDGSLWRGPYGAWKELQRRCCGAADSVGEEGK